MYCPICGSEIRRDREGHECGRDPISPNTARPPAGPFLEDSNGGHVDNAGTWKLIHERWKNEANLEEREADG